MQHKNIILYPVEAAACHSHNELFPVRCPAIKIIFLILAKIYVWPARGQSPASHYNNSNRMILLLNSAKFASVAPSKYIVKNISTKNIPYGQSSAKLPDIQLFRHSVIQSFSHSVIQSSSHPVIHHQFFNLATNRQTISGVKGLLRRQISIPGK